MEQETMKFIMIAVVAVLIMMALISLMINKNKVSDEELEDEFDEFDAFLRRIKREHQEIEEAKSVLTNKDGEPINPEHRVGGVMFSGVKESDKKIVDGFVVWTENGNEYKRKVYERADGSKYYRENNKRVNL